MNRYSIVILTLAAICAAAGQILFKVGADNKQNVLEYFNMPIFFGLFLYAVGTIIWIYALSFEKLINVYAFTVLTFVMVYLGGVFLIKEAVTSGGLIGVAFVLTGLYIIANYSN